MTKRDYDILKNKNYSIKHPYIFLYTINYNDEALQIVNQLGQKLKMSVYTPFTGYSAVKCMKYGIKVLYDVGPREFLSLIDGANYICSNSFHGILFSVLYGKKYFRLAKLDSRGNLIRDDRIDDWFDKIGLYNCTVYEKNHKLIIPEESIDYSLVEKRLEKIRQQGISFLKKALYLER